MRRRLAGLFLMVLLTAFAGCARRSPGGVAQRYIEAVQQFNYPAAYALLTTRDHQQRSLAEFMTEIPLAPAVTPVWFRAVLHQMRFELSPAQRDGDEATVNVKVIAPDLRLWERQLDAAAGPAGVNLDTARRALEAGECPHISYDDRIFLQKEHHHWRVRADFDARDHIAGQHRQALQDFLDLRYEKAAPEYQSMIEQLRRQAATGSLGLANHYSFELTRLEQLMAARPATQAYAAQIKLNGVAMKMSEARDPAIFGEVANNGKRPVDAVVLAVSWYEGRGKDLKLVHREDHLVFAVPLEFTEFTTPLRPLMPGTSAPFGVKLTAPAAIQQHAAPYVSLDRIALTNPAEWPVPAKPQSAKPTPHQARTPAPSPPAR